MKKSLLLIMLFAFLGIYGGGIRAQVSIPYSEDFESYSSGLPTGWAKVGSGTVAVQTTNVHGGSKSLKFNGSTSNIVVLPEFTIDVDKLQISLYSKAETNSSYCGYFDVGYITDLEDASTFVPVESGYYNQYTSYKLVSEVSMSSAPDTARIALRHRPTYTSYYWFVDDILVEEIPACPTPKNLAVSAVTSSSVTLNWTSSSDAWEIKYSTNESFDPASEGTSVVANSKPFTISSGLTEGTVYYAYVRANCTASGDGYSSWSNKVVFNLPFVIDNSHSYSDNFESACNWVFVNGDMTNKWSWGTATNNGGSKSIYVSNDGGTTNAYSNGYYNYCIVYATKKFTLSAGKHNISYDWKANGKNSYDFLRVALVPANTELIASSSVPSGFSYSALPSGWIALDGGSQLYGSSSFATKSINEINIASAGDYMVVFVWRVSSNGSNPPAAIDNFNISKLSCSAPTSLAKNSVTTTTATLGWTSNGDETAWVIKYSTDPDFNPESAGTSESADANPFTIGSSTPLSANTTYYAYVRSDCGGGSYSGWSNKCEFKTLCESDDTPFEENFNSLTVTGQIPDCWDNSEGTTTTEGYKWRYNTTTSGNGAANGTGHNDSKCVVFNSYNNSSGLTNFLKTNNITLPSDKSMQLAFWYKNPAGGDFSVYISTDGGETHTTSLATDLTGASSWTEKKIDLTAYKGEDVVIVFKGTSNCGYNDAYIYLDDVTIEEMSACSVPIDLTVNDITKNSASLGWSSIASAWNIRYKEADAGSWEDTIVTDENPYTLTGLEAQTEYEFQVRTDCGESVYTDWTSSQTFTTKCTEKNLPYFYGFEDADDLDCYVLNNTYSSTGRYNYYAKAGSYCFRFYHSTTYDPQTLVTPLLNTTSKGVRVEFYYRTQYGGSSYEQKFKVGYSKTNDNLSSFTWDDVVTTTSTTYTLYQHDFVESGIKYVAIQYIYDKAYDLYIDDLNISEATSCFKPTSLEASSITSSTASLSWTAGSVGQDHWDIYYSTSSTEPTGETSPSVTNTDTKPYTLTSLTANTTYYVWVRGNCGGGDVSEWSDVESFTTDCATYSIPYSYGFEDASDMACWTMTNCYSGTGRTSSYKRTGSYGFGFNHSSTYVPQYLITPELSGTSAGVHIEFYFKHSATTCNFQIGYSTTTNATGSFTWGTEVTNATNNFEFYEYDCPANTKYICISYNATTWTSLYIDDISLTAVPTCKKPTGLTASDETSSTATLNWTAGSVGQDHWDIYYSTSSTAPTGETEPSVTNTDTKPYTLTSLTSNTTYYVWVRGNCGGGDVSVWSAGTSFTTDCATYSLPYNYGFETAGDMTCWTLNNCYPSYTGRTEGNGYNSSSYCFTFGYNYLYDPQYLITPELSGASAGVHVEFYYKRNSASSVSTFQVGYSTTTNEISAFTWNTATGNPSTAYQFFEEDFKYNIKYIAIKYNATSYDYLYIDDISLSVAPSCSRPKAVAASSITTHRASLSWTPGYSDQDHWDIYYNNSGTEPTGSTVPSVTNTGDNPIELTGLDKNTAYYAWVRGNCGGGDVSSWSKFDCSFSTLDLIAPSDLEASSITTSSALISWSAVATNDNHASYELYYSTSSDTPSATPSAGANYITDIDDTSYLLDDVLSEATTYYVWVRDNNGVDGNSAWSSPIILITAQNPVTVDASHPYSNDFESANDWLLINGTQTNKWAWGTAAHNGTGSTKAIYISNDGGTSHAYTNDAASVTFATKCFSIEEGYYTFSYDWIANGETTAGKPYDFMRVALAPYGTTLSAGTIPSGLAYNALPTGWIALDGGTQLNQSNSWQTKTIEDLEIEEGNYIVVIYWKNDDSGGSQYPAAIDNFSITQNTCKTPTDFAVADSDITHNTAKVSWTGYSDFYTVQYRTATHYNLSEGFENAFSYSNWTAISHSTDPDNTAAMGRLGYDARTGSYSFRFSSSDRVNSSDVYDQYLISPNISGITGNVKFYYKKYTNGTETFKVGYSTTTNDLASFDWGDEITVSNTSYSEEKVYNQAIPSGAKYVAIWYTSQWQYYLYIDDIAIGTEHAAGEWTDAVTDESHEYTTIESLTAGTKYDARVKANCVGGEYCDPISFTTVDNNTKIFCNAVYDWSAVTAWEGGIPAIGNDVILQADATIPDGYTAYARNIEIQGGADPFTLTIEDGGQLVHHGAVNATLKKEIDAASSWKDDADGWYFIASPVDNAKIDESILVEPFDLYKYDEPEAMWYAYNGDGAPFSTMERGMGYLHASKIDQTIAFSGEMMATNEEVSKDLSFTSGLIDDVKGFNLMGNPFTRNLTDEDMVIKRAGDDDIHVLSCLVINDGKNYETCNLLAGDEIAPGKGFFIQADTTGQKLVFNSSSKGAKPSDIGLISIKAGNDEYVDKAFIQIGGGNTLRKIAFSDNNMVYVMDGDDDYAAMTIYELANPIPVHFVAAEPGTYTITVNAKNIDLDYMHLVDEFTNEHIDLLSEPSYTFTSAESDKPGRFTIVFGIDNVEENFESNIFAYQNEDELMVDGKGTLQIFDVLGRFVSSYEVNGSARINISSLNTGVYVLRMVGENVKTQKIVVR